MDKVVNNREGVPIFVGNGVERAIVLYESKLAVLFLHEEDQGSDWGLRGANPTCSEGFLEERVHLRLFDQRHWVDLAKTGLGVALELDHVVPLPSLG